MNAVISAYDAPDGLTDVAAVSTCKADVSIQIKEPFVDGALMNQPSGMKWGAVVGVTVRIARGAKVFSAVSDAAGWARFKDVPCGAWRVTLEQAEFGVENLGDLSIDVAGGRKSGNEFTLKARRQLKTVEMLRLPTLYMASIQGGLGKNAAVDQDPYGHHWLKVYSSEGMAARQRPVQSYVWWPIEGASADRLWDGVREALNGFPVHSRFPDRDPYHTQYLRDDPKLEDAFFPYVTNGKTADRYKSEIASKAAAYAAISGGIWSWRGDGGGYHCKTFQTYLMREVKLWKRLGVGIGSFGWSANT